MKDIGAVFSGIEVWQMALVIVGAIVLFLLVFVSAMARFLKRPSPSEAIIRIGRSKFSSLLREVVENDARLRKPAPAVLEHGYLAHHIDCTIGRHSRFAVEEIDKAWRPARPCQRQHQRSFVCVAALRETIQRVFGCHRSAS